MRFDELDLEDEVLDGIDAMNFQEMTPVQEQTIPIILDGRDIIACAQTGTGKTAAYTLPLLNRLLLEGNEKNVVKSVIIVPTRELAQQIDMQFQGFSYYMPVSTAVIYGGGDGRGWDQQKRGLQMGADVVIATPGRLISHLMNSRVDLSHVDYLILDEADRMLDMGFYDDIMQIVSYMPKSRQTLMFSATMPPEVEKLAMDLLHEPESVKVDPVSSTVKKIDQCLYYVDKANKKHLLAKILRDPDVENALVFSRTKHGADRIVRDLKREGIDAVAIHGDKSQNARQAALTAFKTGECKVLVATDIAARGIDIAGLSHVINYDMPMEPEAYVHRIGRTGRAGRDGTAISFCCIDEVKQLGQVEKLIGKRLPLKESEWPMEITTPSEPKPRQPRPAKLTMQGNAAPERKANRPMSAKPAKLAASAPIREASVEKRAAKSAPREMQVIRREHQQNPVPRFGPASGQRAARSGQPVVIGRDGKMRLGGTPVRVESAPASKPVARTNASGAKKNAGQPVRRVNRSRGRNGER